MTINVKGLVCVGLALVGLAGTIISTVKATQKLEAEDEKLEELEQKESPKERTKRVAKTYAITGVCAMATMAAMVTGMRVSAKAATAVAGTAIVAAQKHKTELVKYRDAIKKRLGDEEEQSVASEIFGNEACALDDYECLFFDALSGEYFIASMERVTLDDGIQCILLKERPGGCTEV